ncbi:hypothetical protein [Streptomyces sp. NPDC047869]|uniref:hypothetical protein n=1 Tax=Streptomyces sp. NPDC047869 TaxID=3154709 RepID=UPI003451CFBC
MRYTYARQGSVQTAKWGPRRLAASDADDGGGKGIVDTLKGWFGADDDEHQLATPPSHDELEVADRQKLPRGKRAAKAKRVAELKSRRPIRRDCPASSSPSGVAGWRGRRADHPIV